MDNGLNHLKTDLDPQIISSIFELSSELVWVLQGDDRLCYASQEQKAKFDIPETIDADFWVSRIHPDDRGRVVLDFNQALKNKKTIFFEHEYRFKSPDRLVLSRPRQTKIYSQ